MAAAFAFTEKDFEAQLKAFFKKEIQDIEDAAGIVIKSAANRHVERMKADAKAAFRDTFHPASKSFPKAFKAYHEKPREELGYASFSRAGPKHMWVYEEGATIAPGKWMLVRTDDGTSLNLPRLGKRATSKLNFSALLNFLFTRFGKKNVGRIKRTKGDLVTARVNGKWLVIYIFMLRVKMPSVLRFKETAEAIGREIPGQIQRLVSNA